MNIQAQKIEIAKDLLEINSPAILNHIQAILKSYQTDLWDELSDEQQSAIKRAKVQLANGEGIPHKEVMKRISKWRTK